VLGSPYPGFYACCRRRAATQVAARGHTLRDLYPVSLRRKAL
jgi:hypothetical protein